MSAYSSFAILGVGDLGKHLVDALVASNSKFIVLSRPSSASTKEIPAGVNVVTVEYTDTAAVTTVLKEHAVDVVVSVVSGYGVEQQFSVADAAKAAGVKLFVPSEFSAVTDGLPWPKDTVARKHHSFDSECSCLIPFLQST